MGLCNIVEEAGCKVGGIGVAIEKSFLPGAEKIKKAGYRLESLARIKSLEDEREAGGSSSHDLDTSPNQKVLSAKPDDPNKTVDFTQQDGKHHLIRAAYKEEHGRFPQTAAEYEDGQRLAEVRVPQPRSMI